MKSNLKKLRKEAGLTMDDLASLANTSKSQIHRLEQNGCNPTLETAGNIITAFGLGNDGFMKYGLFDIWEWE